MKASYVIFVSKIARAAEFASVAHHGQVRFGSDIPFIVHPLRVAARVFSAKINPGISIRLPNAILAAILHDVLEDTKFGSDVIEQKFGREVLAIVRELTQDKKLPRKERRELMILNSCKMSNEAKLIKLADREDNLNFHDMRKFSIQRQRDYCDESLALLEGLRDISAEMEERIMDRIKTIRELVG